MLSAGKDAGLKGDMVWIHPDSLLYRKRWGQSSNTHKTSENTKSTYGEAYWEWFFSRINPKGGSHLYISLTAKKEQLCLHFRPLSHHAWLGAHFALRVWELWMKPCRNIILLFSALFLPQIFWPEIRAHTCLSAGSKSQLLGEEPHFPHQKHLIHKWYIQCFWKVWDLRLVCSAIGMDICRGCRWDFCIWTVQLVLVHRNYSWAALNLGRCCLDVITAWNRGYLPGKSS